MLAAPALAPADLIAADLAHVWHPYASTLDQNPPWLVTDARGSRLVLDDGTGPREVIDAMASWWCMVHGYRHPVLDAAVVEQVGRFSHVMFGGLTHAPAVALVEQLVRLAPSDRDRRLERVFLADSGSVGMEVALKLARQVQIARASRRSTTAGASGGNRASYGRARTRMAALRGGYHGDTLGAMSVCDPVGGMHAMFADSIPAQVFLPRPPAFDADAASVQAWSAQVRDLVAHRDELAGIVVEPVLQGAGGMWPWAPSALRVLRDLADEFELVLIADEIATGLGRTGRLFGCDWAGVVPDILVLGKALTGGYVTQAAVLTSNALAAEVAAGPGGALMHGPTFMANPLACAVSRASLGLIETGAWRADTARIAAVLGRELDPLRGHPAVADVRILGGTAAVELGVPLDSALATRTAIAYGVWLRPFRNLVYAMPPYVASEAELVTIAAAMRAVVDALAERAA